MSSGWRDRAGAALQTRWAAVVELAAIVAITVGHRVFRVIPVDETLPIFLLGWLSLWLRGVGWRGVGLGRPAHVPRTVAVGVAAGILLQLLSEFVTEPAIRSFTHQVADLSEFAPLVGNLKLAMLYFAIVWTWAAIGEELTYRGYVLNRVADVGSRTATSWVAALLVVTALFGFGHSYQGLAGVLDTGIHGLLLGVLYLVAGRNLWPCVIAHGVCDTVGIALIYLGIGLSPR
jgi:uncharacterized protein